MSKKMRYSILAVILFLLIVCVIISVSYGYYVISSNETHEIATATNAPSCAGLYITDNKLINLSGDYAVPLKDEQVLNSSPEILENFKYSFTVTNNCDSDATMSIGLLPVDSSAISTSNLKYALVEKDGVLPESGISFNNDNIASVSDEMLSSLSNDYSISSKYISNFSNIFVSAKTSKEYEFYLWIDYDEAGITSGKLFNGILVLNNFENAQTKLLATYITNDVYNSSANQASITAETKGAGLYKHDATLANGAGDNSYRYAGADADVNNYVCFVGDDCTNEKNLYRIISVDKNNVTKIIKATSLGNLAWNSKTEYTAGTSAEDTAMGLTNGTSYTNIWAIKQTDGSYYTSSLNDYLNGEYLTSLGTRADKVVMTTWNVGGAIYNNDLSKRNVHDFMTYELDMATDDTNKGTYQAKVGLMYAYEYGYAALPEYWNNKLYYNSSDGYNLSYGKDWMLSTNYPWTISRNSYDSYYAFFVFSDIGGVLDLDVSDGYAVRPVLGLSSSIKLINAEAEGVGTKANPMRII